MANHNILDDIFKAEEKDVETFADIVKINQKEFAPNEVLKLKKTNNFREDVQKRLNILHGTHERNYVWHIRVAHPKQDWAVSIERVVYAIGKILNEGIPHDILIDIFPPKVHYGVEVKEFTVKANNALDHWSLSSQDFDRITGQFFEVLDTLVRGPR